jgi:hypothetical protein
MGYEGSFSTWFLAVMSPREARLIMSVISLLSLVWSLGSHVPRTKAWVVRYGRAVGVRFGTVGPNRVGFVLVFSIRGSERQSMIRNSSILAGLMGRTGLQLLFLCSFLFVTAIVLSFLTTMISLHNRV